VGVGFILAFRFVQPLSMLAMLVGIIAVQMMAWIVPLWTLRQGNKK
jgi:F0F1-type ATP synthase assembly protein I